jgi:hypothetical protein
MRATGSSKPGPARDKNAAKAGAGEADLVLFKKTLEGGDK